MANPVRKLDRTRRAARRFAADARALAASGRRRLDAKVRAAIEAACDEVDAAAEDGEPARLSSALRALDALWGEHLERVTKPAWRQYLAVTVAAVVVALVLRVLVVDGYRIASGSMAPTLLPGDHVLVSRLAYGVPVPFTRLRLGGDPPRRGDVVVFESPRARGLDLVKRVVGVPGDVVELRDQVLWINGVPQPRTPDGVVTYEDRSEEGGPPRVETCRRFREALARGRLTQEERGDPGQLEARWQAAAAAGVATYEVLQCRRARLAALEGPFEVVRPGHVFVLGDNRDRSADSRGSGGWQVPLGNVKGRVERVFWSWGLGGRGGRGGAGVRFERLLKPVE